MNLGSVYNFETEYGLWLSTVHLLKWRTNRAIQWDFLVSLYLHALLCPVYLRPWRNKCLGSVSEPHFLHPCVVTSGSFRLCRDFKLWRCKDACKCELTCDYAEPTQYYVYDSLYPTVKCFRMYLRMFQSRLRRNVQIAGRLKCWGCRTWNYSSFYADF
jgi:hypothetical protein